jgi:hypothetical protein
MRKLLFSLIIPALLIISIYGCASELGSDIPREQGYEYDAAGGDTGSAGSRNSGRSRVQYDRGREDYPGQNYATLVGAKNNASGGGTAGNTGTRMSADIGAPAGDGSGLVLMSIRSPVRQGETCALSFRGKPDTRYTITGVYRYSDNMITSTAVKHSGDNGVVEFEWNVSERTDPGTYGIMISGGGEQITASYTVIE